MRPINKFFVSWEYGNNVINIVKEYNIWIVENTQIVINGPWY